MKVKNKIAFILTALGLPFMVSASSLEAGSGQPAFDSGFYAGGSLNFEHMGGRRSDGLVSRTATTFYSDDAGLSDDTAGFELFGGYLYRFDNSNFVVGIEPYFGYKGNKSKLTGLINDGSGIFEQLADLEREWDLGVLARLGYVINELTMIYAVVGPDWGYFKYRQEEVGTPDAVYGNKWISGIRYGAGIERKFSCFRVGLQATMTNYNNSTLSAADSVGNLLFVNTKPEVFTLSLRISYPF